MKESNLKNMLAILLFVKQYFINLKYFELYKASKILIPKIVLMVSSRKNCCVFTVILSPSIRGTFNCNIYAYKHITNYNLQIIILQIIIYIIHMTSREHWLKSSFGFTVNIEIQILAINILNITKNMFHDLPFHISL